MAIKDIIPAELSIEGKNYILNVEKDINGVTLIYEHNPINEDYFLMGCYGLTLDVAVKKMREMLDANT